jgi:hypothetical protein
MNRFIIITITLAAYICICLCACTKTECHRYPEDDQKLCGSLYDHIGNGRVWQLKQVIVNGGDSTKSAISRLGGNYEFTIGTLGIADNNYKTAWVKVTTGFGKTYPLQYLIPPGTTDFSARMPLHLQPYDTADYPISVPAVGVHYEGYYWQLGYSPWVILSVQPTKLHFRRTHEGNDIIIDNFFDLR